MGLLPRAAPKCRESPKLSGLVWEGKLEEKALKWGMRAGGCDCSPAAGGCCSEPLVVRLTWPTLLIPIASRRGRRAAPTQIWLGGSYFFSLLCAEEIPLFGEVACVGEDEAFWGCSSVLRWLQPKRCDTGHQPHTTECPALGSSPWANPGQGEHGKQR